MHITLSSAVGGLGLLERENAAILNASLMPLARHTVPAILSAVKGVGLGEGVPVYLTGNDGTLLSCETAKRVSE